MWRIATRVAAITSPRPCQGRMTASGRNLWQHRLGCLHLSILIPTAHVPNLRAGGVLGRGPG